MLTFLMLFERFFDHFLTISDPLRLTTRSELCLRIASALAVTAVTAAPDGRGGGDPVPEDAEMLQNNIRTESNRIFSE